MSVTNPRVRRTSAKQHVRIWFEFYKLALSDARFAQDVEASRRYYDPWGEVQGISFNKWWLTHSALFDDLKVREVNRVSIDPAVIYLAVPLALGAKRALEQVRDLLSARQKEISEATGQMVGKSSSVRVARFQMTKGTEFRGKIADADLRFYRDVYVARGRPKVGSEFAWKSVQHFREARTKLTLNFLNPSHSDSTTITDDEIRNLRRCVKRAERYVEAAARGDFPGRKLD